MEYLRDSLSATCGAACLVAVGAPFDLLKVRVQLGQSPTPLACLRGVLRTEGVASLWRGCGPAFGSALIENVVLFSSQGLLRRSVAAARGTPAGGAPPPPPWESVAIGALSGVLSATAICPAEVIKVRMQHGMVGGGRFSSALSCAAHVLQEGGPRALFAGLPALLLRDVPFNAVFIPTYRALVAGYRSSQGQLADASLPAWVAMGAGGTAGATAWVIVYPMDVIKSRAQGSGGKAGEPLLMALRAVLAAGGAAALYRGLTAALMRSFPANAALFLGVDRCDEALRSIGW